VSKKQTNMTIRKHFLLMKTYCFFIGKCRTIKPYLVVTITFKLGKVLFNNVFWFYGTLLTKKKKIVENNDNLYYYINYIYHIYRSRFLTAHKFKVAILC
jgi:hypothetical protein